MLLTGVGIADMRNVEYGMVAAHYRRPMTDAETAGLPRKPLILPA